jgi:hypothetical protein
MNTLHPKPTITLDAPPWTIVLGCWTVIYVMIWGIKVTLPHFSAGFVWMPLAIAVGLLVYIATVLLVWGDPRIWNYPGQKGDFVQEKHVNEASIEHRDSTPPESIPVVTKRRAGRMIGQQAGAVAGAAAVYTIVDHGMILSLFTFYFVYALIAVGVESFAMRAR